MNAPLGRTPEKANKWLYGWRLYVNYGQGWEYETFEESWREMRDRLREYRANCPQYPVKASRARELNSARASHTERTTAKGGRE